MTWAKFEDRFPWHRKVRGLSDAAFRLHVSAVCWSCEHLTDGRILRAELHLVSDVKRPTFAAKELVSAGVWDENSERTGWEVHDFLLYNESRETILSRREADAERKRQGRASRPRPAETPPRPDGLPVESKRSPAGQTTGVQAESVVESGRPDPTRPDPTTPKGVVPRKRATQAPDLFPLTDDLREWGKQHCPSVVDPASETRQFLDYHRAKGSTFKDWTAAWRTWMRNAEKFTAERAARLPAEDPNEPWWMRRGGSA